MKVVLVILAIVAVLIFAAVLVILAVSGYPENVNKEPENVNGVNKKSEDAKTGDLGEL